MSTATTQGRRRFPSLLTARVTDETVAQLGGYAQLYETTVGALVREALRDLLRKLAAQQHEGEYQ
jgi:hypothetical protein